MGAKDALLLLGLHLALHLAEVNGCDIGFKQNRRECNDENECEENTRCGDNSMCTNTVGSYYCNCQPGFTSDTANFTDTTGLCTDINECTVNVNPCLHINMKCENTIGSFTCTCPPGYKRARGDNQCVDEDECEIDPPVCGKHGKCTNTPGKYNCTCLPGFHNRGNSSTPCEDINECNPEGLRCGEGGTCNNTPGSYRCDCKPGYSNYGNNRTQCSALSCDQYDTSTPGQTFPGLESVHALMRNSCLMLSNPSAGGRPITGEVLLENLFTATNDLLSNSRLDNSSKVSGLLSAVEKAMRLIGPQLKDPITKMENNHIEAQIAVKRGVARPSGPVSLRMENATLDTSWNTALGNSSYPGFATVALISYKGLENSTNSFHGLNEGLEKGDEEDEDDEDDEGGENRKIRYQVNSKVVTACVSNPETKHLPEPINLTFRHLQKDVMKSGEINSTCVYWNESLSGGAWSQSGCSGVTSNETHTVCSCNHLSSFAVLMALYPIKSPFELQVITWVGLTLSLVCLLIGILTFRFCRSIQGTRNSIHLHLCVCLFIADLVFLCGITSTHNKGGCALVAGLLHYFFLAAFCWMLLEGVQLYRMVVLVFNTTFKPLYMMAAGYGLPLLIVIISAIAYPQGYGTSSHCWLSLKRDFIWSFFAPVCIIIILNCCCFFITLWKLANKLSSLNPDLSNLRMIKGFIITAIAQLCVLGTMWIFGCFLFQNTVMSYLFTLLNSLQGALIFILHCLFSKQVREEYSKLLGSICTRKAKRYSEFSSNQSSNSQQPLRSTPSTRESQI